jgi:hypothetical protein
VRAPKFGVGLSAEGELADGALTYTYQYCQTPGYHESNCPANGPGLNRAHFAVSKQLLDGAAVLAQTGQARAGDLSYSQSVSATPSGDGYGTYALAVTNLSWSDVLHVDSKTLPLGTPVVFEVSLSLDIKSSAIECGRYIQSYGSVGFSGTGTETSGLPIGIYGDCTDSGYYGDFYYRLGGTYGPMGTTDTGILRAKVGNSIPIGVSGNVYTGACDEGFACPYLLSASLGGELTWKITNYTRGVDYRTDIRCVRPYAASCGASGVLARDSSLMRANCARRLISSAAFTSA